MSIRRRRTSRGRLVVACLAALWIAAPSAAQTVGGTLVGRVRDQSAGTLPHARVAFDGFSSQTRKGLTLAVGAEHTVDFEMKVGSLSEDIVVAGEAATIDTV